MTSVKAACEAVERVLSENNVFAEVSQYETLPVVQVEIRWGDWKHEHAKAKWLIGELGFLEWVSTEETEENGTDCYSAIHRFLIVR